MNFLICPFCKIKFEIKNNILACNSCNRTYSIQDEIPLIRDGEGYFYDFEFSQQNMNQMLEIAQKDDNPDNPRAPRGWQKALLSGQTQGMNNISNYAIRYSTDERRAGWKLLLPIDRKSKVLDFGCGLGSISCSLARDAGEVISLDATYERAKFTKIRAKQLDLNNVTPICVNTKSVNLPFQNEFFDIVVINGVLEWIPCSIHRNSPRNIQLNQLKEFVRVLKPNGVIYLGIENRYGWSYWLGQVDHHTGLRFITLLPRFIAHLYSYLVKGSSYRNYFYSWWGYQQLLKDAGFTNVDIYLPFPTYAHFKHLIKADDISTMDYLIHSSGLSGLKVKLFRQFIKTGLQKYFSYSYGIVAFKNIT